MPRRTRHLDIGPLNDQDKVLYAQLRKQSPREIPRFQHVSQDNLPGSNPRRAERPAAQDHNTRRCSPPSGPSSVYSALGLLDSKSRSLPLLGNSSDGEQSYRLSAPPHTPPRLSPKPVRQATGYGPPQEKTDSCSRPSGSHSLEHTSNAAIYHLAGRPGSPHTTPPEMRSSTAGQHSDSAVYAEVPNDALAGSFPHVNAYELIPGHEDAARPKPKPNSNTYEPLEDMRPKNNHSSLGLKVSSQNAFI